MNKEESEKMVFVSATSIKSVLFCTVIILSVLLFQAKKTSYEMNLLRLVN